MEKAIITVAVMSRTLCPLFCLWVRFTFWIAVTLNTEWKLSLPFHSHVQQIIHQFKSSLSIKIPLNKTYRNISSENNIDISQTTHALRDSLTMTGRVYRRLTRFGISPIFTLGLWEYIISVYLSWSYVRLIIEEHLTWSPLYQ